MNPWWSIALGGTGASLLAWCAQAWAKRGTAPETLAALNTTAMGMVTRLSEQVQTMDRKVTYLTAVDEWRVEVHGIDRDHHDVLEAHIWQHKDPPPPPRPVYPSRPVAS